MKLRKPTKAEATTIASAIITILIVLGLVTSCTNTLITLRGQGNKVKQNQNTEVKVDSVTTKIDIKK